MKKPKAMTDEEVKKIFGPIARQVLGRDKDYYPICILEEGGEEKRACPDCFQGKFEIFKGIQKVPRGTTVACDYCGNQIPEPPILPTEH